MFEFKVLSTRGIGGLHGRTSKDSKGAGEIRDSKDVVLISEPCVGVSPMRRRRKTHKAPLMEARRDAIMT